MFVLRSAKVDVLSTSWAIVSQVFELLTEEGGFSANPTVATRLEHSHSVLESEGK